MSKLFGSVASVSEVPINEARHYSHFDVVDKSEVPLNDDSQDLLLMFLLSARPFNQPGQRCCCCVELLVCEYADPVFDS